MLMMYKASVDVDASVFIPVTYRKFWHLKRVCNMKQYSQRKYVLFGSNRGKTWTLIFTKS